MIKETSEAVRESRKRQGVTPTSFALNEAEKEILERAREKLGGSKKDAVMAGLRLVVNGSEPDVAAILERLAREIRTKDQKKKPKRG